MAFCVLIVLSACSLTTECTSSLLSVLVCI